ncbi:MAG: ROK family protein, partial [Planctomycetota bacterium]
ASAVAVRTSEAILAGAKTSLASLVDGGKALTAKHVYEAALEGDGLALQIIDETAFYLGVGVTGAVHTIDPGIVVLGGAMDFGGKDCSIGQRFLKGITDEFRRRTFPNVAEGTKIEFASLGGAAGHIGAAGIARVDHHRS